MRSFSQTLNVKGPPGIDLPGIDSVQIASGFRLREVARREGGGAEKALARRGGRTGRC